MSVTDPSTAPTTASGTPPVPVVAQRVRSVDAVRGLAIVVMLLAMPPGFRGGLPEHLTHPPWHGVNFADLFFPAFLFAIGAAMPFSARAAAARPMARRVGLLFVLGIAVTSVRNAAFGLAGVLQHIAIAYLLAWAVLRLPRRAQWTVCVAALLAYWLAFVAFADGADPWSRAGGFAHEANAWVYGGFRTEGWPQSAISFVNVMAGVAVGRWLVEGRRGPALLRRTAAWAVGSIGVGLVLSVWIPLNKYLWSPSYTVLTAGTSLAWFGLLYWLLDQRGCRRAGQPLVHLGTNAIAVYVVFIGGGGALSHHLGPLDDTLRSHLTDTTVSLGWALLWLLLGWWFAAVMHRRKLFFKV